MEQLSASLGDRKADLLIKMNPPIVTTETIKELSPKAHRSIQVNLIQKQIKHSKR